MEKERKITAPEGCEIEKVELVDGAAVITFKKKDRKLPIYGIKEGGEE